MNSQTINSEHTAGTFMAKETMDALHAVSKTRAWRDRDSLKRVKKTGALVLPCDLVCQPADIATLVYKARVEPSPSRTALWALFGNAPFAENAQPGKQDKDRVMPETLISVDGSGSIINIQGPEEFQNETYIPSIVSMNDTRGLNTTLYSQRNDLHAYMFQPWLFNFCVATRAIHRYGELPFKCSHKSDHPQKAFEIPYDLSSIHDSLLRFLALDFNSGPDLEIARKLMFHYKDLSEGMPVIGMDLDVNIFPDIFPEETMTREINVKFCKVEASDGFEAVRVVDLTCYLKANAQLLAAQKRTLYSKEKDTAKDFVQKTKSYISSDETIIKANKNEIKGSTVSRGCVIAPGACIVNSIIYNNCVIQENAKLTNCIVYSNTRIPKGCQLKDCIIGQRSDRDGRKHLTDSALVTGESCCA